MAFSGIDVVVFGVTDITEARRFLDDWGTHPIAVEADRLVYATRDGGQIIVRPKDAADLPPAIEPGNTVREVIWGAASDAELESGLNRFTGALTVGPDAWLTPASSGIHASISIVPGHTIRSLGQR